MNFKPDPDDDKIVEKIKTFVLKNGTVVLSEHIPHIKSILLGLWVKSGSRNEVPESFGMAHFVEHMLFKGTGKRNSKEIAESMESVGGDLNAFTSREHCCYYARSINEHTELIFDVISDILFHSRFEEMEIEREKNVVCQEIDMYDDAPEELCHELLVQNMYGPCLGHPVVGSKENVCSFAREDILNYHQMHYQPSNLVLTVVGNFENHSIESLAEEYFSHNPENKKNKSPLSPEACSTGVHAQHKDLGQCHLAMGWHAYCIAHNDRYVLHLINTYLGGGMSSLLFQEIREKLGLVYNIYSFIRAYTDSGFFGLYSAHAKDSTGRIMTTIRSILRKVCAEGIPEEKLTQLKYQLKTGLLLGLEKTPFRMNRIGVGHLYFNKVISANELIDLINAVTNEDVIRVANQVFHTTPCIVSVGDLLQEDLIAAMKQTEL
jgi:predicted Zn-dependent peptidase